MTTREFAKFGLALAVGAALALPAGFVLGRLGGPGQPAPPVRREGALVRDVFSPSIRTDPYFLNRQREGVEALKRYCARTGESCAEARAARVRLEQLEMPD